MKRSLRWSLVGAAGLLVAACAYGAYELRKSPLWYLQSCADTAYAPASWLCEQALFSQHPTPQELADMNQRAGALFAVHQVKEANARRFLAHYIKAGLDINAIDRSNGQQWTALHLVARDADPGSVRVLLEHGADVTLKDAHGRTAVDRARERHAKYPTPESAEVLKLLESRQP